MSVLNIFRVILDHIFYISVLIVKVAFLSFLYCVRMRRDLYFESSFPVNWYFLNIATVSALVLCEIFSVKSEKRWFRASYHVLMFAMYITCICMAVMMLVDKLPVRDDPMSALMDKTWLLLAFSFVLTNIINQLVVIFSSCMVGVNRQVKYMAVTRSMLALLYFILLSASVMFLVTSVHLMELCVIQILSLVTFVFTVVYLSLGDERKVSNAIVDFVKSKTTCVYFGIFSMFPTVVAIIIRERNLNGMRESYIAAIDPEFLSYGLIVSFVVFLSMVLDFCLKIRIDPHTFEKSKNQHHIISYKNAESIESLL